MTFSMASHAPPKSENPRGMGKPHFAARFDGHQPLRLKNFDSLPGICAITVGNLSVTKGKKEDFFTEEKGGKKS